MKGGISAVLTTVSVYFHILLLPIAVLIATMVIDYMTGMISAWLNSDLSSKRGIRGIVKKVCYMVLVAVAIGVDYLIQCGLQMVNIDMNIQIFFGILVTIWLIINEMISILENLTKIGVPIPTFLMTMIQKLKITTEQQTENQKEKKK